MDSSEEAEYTSMSNDEDESRDMITLSGDFAEKIWVPDTFFANDKNRYIKLSFKLIMMTHDNMNLQFPARCHRT